VGKTMTTGTQEKVAVKKGRKPNPPSQSVGSAFLVLRVFTDDIHHLEEDESIEDRSLKTAKKRVIELYTENKNWAHIDAIAQKLDGTENVLFSMCYLDAFPFFIKVKDFNEQVTVHHYSVRKVAQAAHKELDQQYGGVVASNAFDRTVKSN
jgi:hypothetical protein